MSVETMAALSRLPLSRGVKDATGDLVRPLKQRVASGPKFCMLDGDDASAIAFNAHCGTGCISGTGTIAPKHCAQLQEARLSGPNAKALGIPAKLQPLHSAVFVAP